MALGDGVPVTSSLKDIYGEELEVEVAAERFRALTLKFAQLYGEGPELVSRAPGRVNLIGEHIDYEGYSVLPMAILLDTLVAIRPSPSHTCLRLANVNPSKYPPIELSASPDQEVDTARHHWGNYFLCGYKGVFDQLRKVLSDGGPHHSHLSTLKAGTSVGLDILVDGAVPPGAGLSSSAALVCSAIVAVMAALDASFSKQDIADLACRSERYIGTQSGGMDQAISLLALPGVAKLIDFNPLRASDVVLPRGSSFVIANSLAVSEKAVTAATNYNRRVVECRLAAVVLGVKLGMPVEEALGKVSTLKDVEELCSAYSSSSSSSSSSSTTPKHSSPSNALPAVEEVLHEEAYSREELEGLLGKTLEEVFHASPSSLRVLQAASSFRLKQRAKHVYSEASRVYEFRDICAGAAAAAALEDSTLSPKAKPTAPGTPDSAAVPARSASTSACGGVSSTAASSRMPSSSSTSSSASAAAGAGRVDEAVLVELGKLMNASHESCRVLYECSSPELDELVDTCRNGGAFGARLTGAGWGGCAVALVTSDKAQSFVDFLKENFYASRIAKGVIGKDELETCVFASPPAGGAAIFLVQG